MMVRLEVEEYNDSGRGSLSDMLHCLLPAQAWDVSRPFMLSAVQTMLTSLMMVGPGCSASCIPACGRSPCCCLHSMPWCRQWHQLCRF